MIGMKELNLITGGKKIVGKYKKNFSKFMENDFYVRFILVDENGKFKKAIEYIVNANNVIDYLTNDLPDFGDLKVDKVEFSASGR